MKVSLWSGPRNCSTALMYSFAQRSDFQVFDEPLFAHFLKRTGAKRPSREEVLGTMSTDLNIIQSDWNNEHSHVFLKHMANHLEGVDDDVFQNHFHVFLIRNPHKVIKSFRAHVDAPTVMDLCYGHQWMWLQKCIQHRWPYLVVDSDDLVANPSVNLKSICAFLKLPFEQQMLSWEPGARPEDGVWAKYWYHRVHASRGWESRPQAASVEAEVPHEFRALLAEVEPVFRRLQQHIITSQY
jgi:hypothetical protein